MYLKRLLLLILILGLAEPAMALRCGSKLVRDGDHKSKVLKYCGEPTGVQTRTIYRGGVPRSIHRSPRHTDSLLVTRHAVVEIIVEEWTYNFGPRRLMRMVRFENGFVTEVTQLTYGYRD